jgi:hypothetical protein
MKRFLTKERSIVKLQECMEKAMDVNVVIKLYYEEILDKREVHCQVSRVYGEGYVASVEKSSLYVLQTSPCL